MLSSNRMLGPSCLCIALCRFRTASEVEGSQVLLLTASNLDGGPATVLLALFVFLRNRMQLLVRFVVTFQWVAVRVVFLIGRDGFHHWIPQFREADPLFDHDSRVGPFKGKSFKVSSLVARQRSETCTELPTAATQHPGTVYNNYDSLFTQAEERLHGN